MTSPSLCTSARWLRPGDRMPPIHWEAVGGDRIKPSMFDYCAVIQNGGGAEGDRKRTEILNSLRQTWIIGSAMAKIRDAIQFHNCLDNVLEYCSDRDSGKAMRNLCAFDVLGFMLSA